MNIKTKVGAALMAMVVAISIGWSASAPASASIDGRVVNYGYLPLHIIKDSGLNLYMPGNTISSQGVSRIYVDPAQCVLIPARSSTPYCSTRGASILVYDVTYAKRTK